MGWKVIDEIMSKVLRLLAGISRHAESFHHGCHPRSTRTVFQRIELSKWS
jgi:hypothetical protein